MKKTLLSFIFTSLSLFNLSAQCIIAPSCTLNQFGYCVSPPENSNLPNATVGSTYSTVIQISLGSSISGGLATINGATLTAISGLPTGLTYSSNPINGALPPNSSACVILDGTPAAGTAGTYTVTADVFISTNIISQSRSAKWILTVDPASTTTSIKNSTDYTNSMIVAPNPTSSDLTVSAPFHFSKIQIIDALGKVVISHDANYAYQTTIDVKTLSKGVYFLQANDGNRLITKKFIKD